MAQGDLNVANQSGAAFRADLNNQLLALGTLQSGASEPSTTYAYTLWADTTAGQLKQRNAANNAWVVLGTLGSANLGLVPGTQVATTSAAGIVQLTDSTSSTSTTTASTPNAVKTAWDLANAALPKAGGTLTGNVNVPSLNGGQLAGMRNRIINGDARVGQRGSVTFTSTNNLYGWADRWLYSVSATTVSALAFRASGSLGAGGPASGCAIQVGNVLTTGTTTVAISQRIESLNCFDLNSATVTVSGKVLHTTGSAQTLTASLGRANALDNFTAQTVISSTGQNIPHNVWTPFTWTLTLGATDASNGLQLSLSFNSMAAQSTTQFYFSDIQLERGAVATPFEARSFGQELALCQRYYIAETLPAIRYGRDVASLRLSTVWVDFPVTMRATPTTTQVTSGSVGTQTVSASNRSLTVSASASAGDMAALQSYTASIEL